jgi:hypothetical protein
MNKGIDEATGDYLIFLNSGDTFFDEDVLSLVMGAVLKSNRLDLYYGNVAQVDDAERVGMLRFAIVDLYFLFSNMICHQGIFAKRDLFLEHGKFDLAYRISGDYDWLLRILLNKTISRLYLDIPVASFQMGGISMTQSEKKQAERESIKSKYFSKTTITLMAILRATRVLWLVWFMNRSMINRLIQVSSISRWKRLGLH